MQIPIIYKDNEIIVINKPAFIATHPAKGWKDSTLTVSEILHDLTINATEKEVQENSRQGIVHRLDANTSGVMVLARTENALEQLKKQFKNRTVKKKYIALVQGYVNPLRGIIKAPIGRKETSGDFRWTTNLSNKQKAKKAITKYKVIKHFQLNSVGVSLVKVKLLTGRTHQIRVHFQAIGHAVIGDSVYGGNGKFADSINLNRQFLHSYSLKFIHPKTGKTKKFIAPLPKELLDILPNNESLLIS